MGPIFLQLFTKLDCDDMEILEHTRELLLEVEEWEGQGGESSESGDEENSDNENMDVS